MSAATKSKNATTTVHLPISRLNNPSNYVPFTTSAVVIGKPSAKLSKNGKTVVYRLVLRGVDDGDTDHEMTLLGFGDTKTTVFDPTNVGDVVMISGASVQSVDQQFRALGGGRNYELRAGPQTKLQAVEGPRHEFDDWTGRLANVAAGRYPQPAVVPPLHCVVVAVGPITAQTTKNGEQHKCVVVLSQEDGVQLPMTVWGTQSELERTWNENIKPGSILDIREARASEFRGEWSLSISTMTTIQATTSSEKATANLARWWSTVGRDVGVSVDVDRRPSVPRVTDLSSALASDQPGEYVQVRGRFISVDGGDGTTTSPGDVHTYTSCGAGQGRSACQKIGRACERDGDRAPGWECATHPSREWGADVTRGPQLYRLQLALKSAEDGDGDGEQPTVPATLFGRTAETFMGDMSAYDFSTAKPSVQRQLLADRTGAGSSVWLVSGHLKPRQTDSEDSASQVGGGGGGGGAVYNLQVTRIELDHAQQ